MMKIDKQNSVSSAVDGQGRIRPNLPLHARKESGDKPRVATPEVDVAHTRAAARASGQPTSFNLQLNQQLSSMQATDRYLGELVEQLSSLKLGISKQLAGSSTPSDRENIVTGLETLAASLNERAKRTANSLDANFNLRLNEPLRSRFDLNELSTLQQVAESGGETLLFTAGRALDEPLAVVLDDGMSLEDVLRTFNQGMGSAGIRAEADNDGRLSFTIPEQRFQQLKHQLHVKGNGKLFPVEGKVPELNEQTLLKVDVDLVQGSVRDLRLLLDSSVAALDKMGSLRQQLHQRQDDVREFLARQENQDEKVWAKQFSRAVFDFEGAKGHRYGAIAQAVVAQSNISRFTVVGLLS